MPLLGLVVVLCALVLLIATVPFALAVVIAAAQWAWSSGFLATLGAALVVIAVLVVLDPRERRR